MEERISNHIRGIFMLKEKALPRILEKHLTNNPNKEAMEHVLYYLLPLVIPNCFKNTPWPIKSLKEAAEFRNAAILIINNLEGFVYEQSSNVAGKVQSSLLTNPGGPKFVFFMYQLCVYVKGCELKKKGFDVLNPPSYFEDEYIDKKIAMFSRISESNFKKVNKITTRVDFALQNIKLLALKYQQIIQESNQYIQHLKSELLNIDYFEWTSKKFNV